MNAGWGWGAGAAGAAAVVVGGTCAWKPCYKEHPPTPAAWIPCSAFWMVGRLVPWLLHPGQDSRWEEGASLPLSALIHTRSGLSLFILFLMMKGSLIS